MSRGSAIAAPRSAIGDHGLIQKIGFTWRKYVFLGSLAVVIAEICTVEAFSDRVHRGCIKVTQTREKQTYGIRRSHFQHEQIPPFERPMS